MLYELQFPINVDLWPSGKGPFSVNRFLPTGTKCFIHKDSGGIHGHLQHYYVVELYKEPAFFQILAFKFHTFFKEFLPNYNRIWNDLNAR